MDSETFKPQRLSKANPMVERDRRNGTIPDMPSAAMGMPRPEPLPPPPDFARGEPDPETAVRQTEEARLALRRRKREQEYGRLVQWIRSRLGIPQTADAIADATGIQLKGMSRELRRHDGGEASLTGALNAAITEVNQLREDCRAYAGLLEFLCGHVPQIRQAKEEYDRIAPRRMNSLFHRTPVMPVQQQPPAPRND